MPLQSPAVPQVPDGYGRPILTRFSLTRDSRGFGQHYVVGERRVALRGRDAAVPEGDLEHRQIGGGQALRQVGREAAPSGSTAETPAPGSARNDTQPRGTVRARSAYWSSTSRCVRTCAPASSTAKYTPGPACAPLAVVPSQAT